MEWKLSQDAWQMLLQRLDTIDSRLGGIENRFPPKGLCDAHTNQIDSLRKRLWVQTGAIGALSAVAGALIRGLF